LANIAHHTLFAAANHPVLISSNSAVLALIEGLVAAVMTQNKEAVRLSAELTESVLSYLHVSANSKPSSKRKPLNR
jgi:DNA-binding MurR/RpiR family transcriptional regulator